MQLCLRCAQVDGMDNGYECDPKSHQYEVDISAVLTAPDPDAMIAETCTLENPNDTCVQNLCMCDMEMIKSVIDLLWDEIPSEKETYLHENGFDVTENCVSGQTL